MIGISIESTVESHLFQECYIKAYLSIALHGMCIGCGGLSKAGIGKDQNNDIGAKPLNYGAGKNHLKKYEIQVAIGA